MIFIGNILDFKLYKNKIIKIFKNNVAYLKNNDKILFEVDENKFCFSFEKSYFIKEDKDTIFYIDKDAASIDLKKYNKQFYINVEQFSINMNNNKYIINYKIESDEELTNIEINTYNE